MDTPDYTIFGSPISLFTRKLEAALELYGAPFIVERKDDGNREALEQRSGTHQIPVLKTSENWMLADTTPILMLLDSRFSQRRLFPPGPLGVLVHIIEEVLDEWTARVMVHYRWHYDDNTQAVVRELLKREVTVKEARNFPLAQWGLRACRATGTEMATQQTVAEREYLGILTALQTQLQETQFSLGDRPCAADAILIGGLRGHTNNDPIPDLSEFPTVLEWDKQVSRYNGTNGNWDAFPGSTPFAKHMLKLAREQYKPFIIGNRKAIASGDKAFTVTTYGEKVSYLCRPYPERSRQMIVNRICQLERDDRGAVIEWLGDIGLDNCFLD
ncbi:MAG: glutathione S-transferase family protein [Gammaproteobacteria bacterium]